MLAGGGGSLTPARAWSLHSHPAPFTPALTTLPAPCPLKRCRISASAWSEKYPSSLAHHPQLNPGHVLGSTSETRQMTRMHEELCKASARLGWVPTTLTVADSSVGCSELPTTRQQQQEKKTYETPRLPELGQRLPQPAAAAWADRCPLPRRDGQGLIGCWTRGGEGVT